MTDINLSAEIEVQRLVLDKTLRKQLEDNFKGVKIDPVFAGRSQLAQSLNNRSKSLDLKVRLQVSNPKGFQDQALGKNRTWTVDLKIGNLKQILQSLSKVATPVSKSTENLQNILNQQLGGSSGVKTPKDTYGKDVVDTLQRIRDLAKTSTTGGFFDFASNLSKNFDVSQLGAFIERLRGLGGDDKAIKNYVKSLEVLFANLKQIDNQSTKLRESGIVSGPLVDGLKQARQNAIDLFNTIEASNPNTLRTQLGNMLSPYNRQIGEAIRDTQDFNKFLDDLTRKSVKLQTGGASQAEIQNITDLAIKAQELRNQGFSTPDIKNALAGYEQLGIELDNVRKKSTNVLDSLRKLNVDKSVLNLGETFGGKLLNFDQNLRSQLTVAVKSIRDIEKGVTGSGDKAKQKINDIKNKTGANIRVLEQDVKNVNNLFERLTNSFTKFDTAGLDRASDRVKNLAKSMVTLVKSGASVEQIKGVISKGLIEADKIAEDERRINSMINALERLRSSLLGQFDAGFDRFGVGKAIDNLQKKVKSFGNTSLLTPDREKELKSILSSGSFDIRALNQSNRFVEDAIGKFDKLAIAAKTPIDQEIFSRAGHQFIDYAETIAKGGGTARQKLIELQREFTYLLTIAKVDVEGGILKSISKQAGLATKRLAGFLLVGPAFFAIGDGFRRAVSSAIDLEVQFTKLEQVFSKTFKNETVLGRVTNSLRRDIFDLSKEFGIASEEITKATRILAQAGIVGDSLRESIRAITKAQLGATFNDIGQTSEALVAIFNQFNDSGRNAEKILGGINQVSAKYAVESEGIAKAVRKAGGAFNAAGGDLDEFVAAFTILKKETREADEALGTGLRTIVNRLQRTKTEKTVKDLLNVDLRDQQGQFIGFTKSLDLITKKLNQLGIKETDRRFNQLIETIAGLRQRSRLLPLIQNFKEFKTITEEYARGSKSLNDDAARATDNFARRVERLRASLTELTSSIIESDAMKFLTNSAVNLTHVLTGLVKQLGSLETVLLSVASIKLVNLLNVFKSNGPLSVLPATIQTFLSEAGVKLGGFLGGGGGAKLASKTAGGVGGAIGSLPNFLPLITSTTKLSGQFGILSGALLAIGGMAALIGGIDSSVLKLRDFTFALVAATASAYLYNRATNSGIDTFKNLGRRVTGGFKVAQNVPVDLDALGTKVGSSRLGSLAAKFGPQIGKLGKLVTVVGTGFVFLNTVTNLLTDSIKRNAETIIQETLSEEEALKAFKSSKRAEAVSNAIKSIGSAIVGAIGGFTLTGGNPLGALAGALTGFLDPIIQLLNNSGVSSTLFKIKKLFLEDIPNSFLIIKQYIQQQFPIVSTAIDGTFITFDYIADKVKSGAISFVKGIGIAFQDARASVNSELISQGQEKLVLSNVDLNQIVNGPKDQVKKNIQEFTERFVQGFEKLSIALDGDIDAIQNTNPEIRQKAQDFVDAIKNQIRTGTVKVGDVKKIVGDVDFGRLKAAFKKLNIDLEDEIVTQFLAISELSALSARMASVIAGVNNELDSVESYLDRVVSRSADRPQFRLASTDFNAISQGFKVTGLIANELEETYRQFKAFNSGAADVLKTEVDAQRAARELSENILSNKNLSFDSLESLREALKAGFSQTANNNILEDIFDNFITNVDDNKLAEAFAQNIDGKSIQDLLVKEFVASFQQGGIEAFKRFNDVQNKFTDQFKSLAQRRLAAENELLGGIQNVSKLQLSFVSLLSRIGGDPLKASSQTAIGNAKVADQRVAGQLTGNTNASVVGTLKSILNQRTFINQLRQGQGNFNLQQRELLTDQALNNIEKGKQFLEFIAGGTNELARAAEAFETRAEHAKQASEQFSKALFGSDKDVLDTATALQDMFKILSSKNQNAARSFILGLTEDRRQALQNLPEFQRERIDKKLGINKGIDLSNTLEAKNLIQASKEQIQAQQALNTTFGQAITSIDQLIIELKNQQVQALNQALVNQFSNAAKVFTAAVDRFPHEIQATVNGTINVNVTGAQVLGQIDKQVGDLVKNEIQKGLSRFNAANANQFNLPVGQA